MIRKKKNSDNEKEKKMLGYIKKEKENDENKRKKNWETVGKKKFRHDWEEIKQKMRKGNEREKKIIVGEPNNLFLCLYCWMKGTILILVSENEK